MKVNYSKILLFSLPLNILLSSYAHNKNKPYITTPHTLTTISRVLNKCDINTSIYDDPDMKFVKENFYRQTSQRFEEYEEHKIEKTLAEKVEKVCLMCACGLGGGVAPVWSLVSCLWYEKWSQYIIAKVLEEAIDDSNEAGIAKAIEGLGSLHELGKLVGDNWSNIVTPETYSNPNLPSSALQWVNITMCYNESNENVLFCNAIQQTRQNVFVPASKVAADADEAGKIAYSATEKSELLKTASATNALSTAIISSVLSIIVIVLVMVIIYLILRYRRKKKMNKKLQYTKLLNQ
ncbi:hypothetical protein PFAG_01869 [Plasmodium falciparum Santa Lucia]|uniref:Surface antigen n=1 Tax=Plasmodium falciparum Santa Lucia TaxID=478859 RepID=W7G0Y0_PLAFA|nr:hypothetical protein PFAG_01869 [Plasmodium falciparum Santa Lucia]